jgi:hypothetical protein
MFRSVRGRSLPVAVIACACLAGPVAGAQASNTTIVNTLNSYGPKLDHDEAAVLNGLADYQDGRAAPLIKALRHEVADIHALRGALSPESTSSTAGATGKQDVLTGLKRIAKAYGALASDVQKASHGTPVPKAKVQAAITTDKKGRRELKAGLKLLAS